MQNDVITLVSVANTVNELGDTVSVRTEREIFAEVRSIGMKETYEALAHGLKPELTFVLADYYDYNDEMIVIYEEKEYRVLRTYRNSNALELVVTKNGASS